MAIKFDPTKWFSRRHVLAGLGATAAASVASAAPVAPAGRAGDPQHRGQVDAWLAKEEIAELRRLYARATDLIGLDTEAGVAEGRATYHRVFTSDAKIGATGQPRVTGPDAWVKVANDALREYQDTQHLIGTQIVNVLQLPDAEGRGGEATMTSYLQAWHAKADGELWLFIGTYHDKARSTPGIGWQIYDMSLQQVSGDRRQLGA